MPVYFLLEILQNIGFYFGSVTCFNLILGIKVDKKRALYEGGFSIILDKILLDYQDRYALVNLKKYLSNKEVPLYKAVLTGKMSLLALVSEVWGSRHSDFAYVQAIKLGFLDALDFIEHDIPPLSAQHLNLLLIRTEAYNKVDLTVNDPLRYVTTQEYISSGLRCDDLLSDMKLRIIYEQRGDIVNFVRALDKILKKEGYTSYHAQVDVSQAIEVYNFYNDRNEFEKAILWLRKLCYEKFSMNDFLNVVCRIRDVQVLVCLNDILKLDEWEIELNILFIEEDIPALKEIYINYPEEVLLLGEIFYSDVLELCDLAIREPYLEEEENDEAEEDEDEEDEDDENHLDEEELQKRRIQ